MKRTLPRSVVKMIHGAVDAVFDKAVARLLARPPVDKRIYLGTKPRVTLPSLFEAASAEERAKADQDVLRTLLQIAEGFVDAQRHSTKAHVVKAVESWLNKAAATGVDTDVKTVLEGELAGVWRKASDTMHKIVASESNVVKNTGTLDGVVRVNAASGIEDPVVYFVVVRDDKLCDECRRLHLLDDGKTPKLWYLSEVGHGYHKAGEADPKLGGLHPHCRCTIATMLPGYGFDGAGMVKYVAPGHVEIHAQRGIEKSESDDLEKLAKSTPKGARHYYANHDAWDANGEVMPYGEHLDSWIEHMRHHAGVRVPEGHSDEQALHDHLLQAPVTINFPWSRFAGIAESGRFKTVFDTNHSVGGAITSPDDSYNSSRTYAENRVLGIPEDTHRDERPVYGAVNARWNQKNHQRGGAWDYGDMYVTLKPEVHARTSFTPDDSFSTNPEDTVTHRHLPKLFSHFPRRADDKLDYEGYIEAQVHGGVDLAHDVKSLHLSHKTPAHVVDHAVEVGKKFKFPVYHQAEKNEPAALVYHPDHDVVRPKPAVKPKPEPKKGPVVFTDAHYEALGLKRPEPRRDQSGLVPVGSAEDFKMFKAEKYPGIFVAFRGAETGIDLPALTKIVQQVTTATCPTARIFQSRKNFKIFVQDREQADTVIASIQDAVLGGD